MTPALTSSCQLAMKLFDGGWDVRGVFLDIALDKVWHRFLLLKLKHNEISGNFLFFNWDSLHARLNSHYKAWNYKKKHKKITVYRKSVLKEPAVKRCLLILDLKPLKS